MKLFIENHTENFKLRTDHASLLSRNHPSTNFSQFILQWEWGFGFHPDH